MEGMLGDIERHLLLGDEINLVPLPLNEILIPIDKISVPISKEFVDELERFGYIVICVLGSGAESTSLLTLKEGKIFSLLLRISFFPKIQARKLQNQTERILSIMRNHKSGSYLNLVRDVIYIDIPYSNDAKYLSSDIDNYKNRPIYVLEYMVYTLRQLMELKSIYWNKDDFVNFYDQVESFLRESFDYFESIGLYYTDLKLENIMIGYRRGVSYFKLIDIDSIRKLEEGETFDRVPIEKLMGKLSSLYHDRH